MADASVTVDDLLAEIDKYFAPPRQLGDIDSWQLAERYGISQRQGFGRMESLAKTGKYEMVKVYDPDRKHEIRVLRKIE